MAIAFKRTFLALLTTLFVSAMTLPASSLLADDANKDQLQTNKQTCQTQSRSDAFTAENRQEVLDNKGEITELEGVRASAFQSRVEDLLNAKAPFAADYILIVKPNDEDDTNYNVGFFEDNCLKAIVHLPPTVVPQLLGPKVPLGERVD